MYAVRVTLYFTEVCFPFTTMFSRNSNLPYFDLVRLSLPKSGALPVATVEEMQKHLAEGVYAEFEYFYFTEADQMLVMRSPEYVFRQLNENAMYTVVPHRLVPYAKEVHDIVFEKTSRAAAGKAKKKIKEKGRSALPTSPSMQKKQGIVTSDNHFGWMKHSCCMPRQNCLERENWVPLLSDKLPYMNIFGLHIALGNSNFHKLTYRPCVMLEKSVVDSNYCP